MKECTMAFGTELNREDQNYVLNAYVHRFTGQHTPQWAVNGMPNGKPYPVQFKDDNDWLAHTKFHVKMKGKLDKQWNHCESYCTWPNNPELRSEHPVHIVQREPL